MSILSEQVFVIAENKFDLKSVMQKLNRKDAKAAKNLFSFFPNRVKRPGKRITPCRTNTMVSSSRSPVGQNLPGSRELPIFALGGNR